MLRSRYRLPLRVLTALALLANAVAVFMPGGDGVPLFSYADKIIHVLIFAVPALLGLLAGLPRRPWLAGLAVYAPVTEILQATLIPSRDGSFGDLTADLLGLVSAAVVWHGIRENGTYADDGPERAVAGRHARDR
ncbi:MAG TPA: hypothetical protein PKH97_02695 [Tetrasphaera sp.]|uniref:hypothetical protein n=1 Tax=Nostocoides sp. TaxID=1917966 RepID=UPI002C691C0A|nr:hypothetical protein [Tetrasphaera sp.]HNQ06076.1 hypothetical protein [Tetrasphaera sp.]